jgi:hypothetical protein
MKIATTSRMTVIRKVAIVAMTILIPQTRAVEMWNHTIGVVDVQSGMPW